METVMLHSLQPAEYVASRHLQMPSNCPECDGSFIYGHGVMSLTHYCDLNTKELQRGLMCFCSTRCLLRWEHPTLLGQMH